MQQIPENSGSDSHDATAASTSRESQPAERAKIQPSPRLVEILDLITLTGLVVMTPIAWLLPQHLWSKVGRFVVAVAMKLLPQIAADTAATIDHGLGPTSDRIPTREIIIRTLSRYFENNLLILKCYRPDGWEPEVELQGLEHLQAAVSHGKGVVLWISHFHFFSLLPKIATHRAGFAMHHLSHPRHGFSGTRFGMRFLNPICTYVEDRYLKERVYMELNSGTVAVKILRERLLAGGVTSIVARNTARKPVRVPCLTGTLPLAIGAPNLAHQTQAPLLPVYAVEKASGAFAVIIDTPIALDVTQPKGIACEGAAREFARRMEAVVREYPDQWLGWGYLETSSSSMQRQE